MNTDKLVFGIIGGITLLITGIIIATSFSSTSSSELQTQEIIGSEPHILGAQNARLTIVEFSDFECPYCAQAAPMVKSLLAQYPNDLAIVYRHYPLPSHPGAIPAARASEAAAKQGKFWEYADELFANQPDFSQAQLEQYAEVVGLNLEQFKADYASDDVISKVQEDADYGRQISVRGTPTFYVVYDGKAEFVNLQQSTDLETKVRSILGEPAETLNENGNQTDGNGPSIGTQVPADMPANIPMAVTLDIINVQRDNVAPSQVNISTVTKEEWSDASLGCPKEGEVYAQVITPGYKVIAEANGETFEYHTNEAGDNLVLCENP